MKRWKVEEMILRLKRIICIARGHSLVIKPYYDWSDKNWDGIEMVCLKCNLPFQTASRSHVLSILKEAGE